MGLRARVALILAAAIIPISLGFSVWRMTAEHHEVQERRAERLVSRLQQLNGMCHPAADRRARNPLLFYSADLQPHRHATPFPPALADRLSIEEPVHVRNFPGVDAPVTMQRLAESGRCSVVVAVWRDEALPRPVVRAAVHQTFGLTAALAVLGMLVALPIVRRIRRLEDAVRRAKTDDFDHPLTGSDEIAALAIAFHDSFAAVRAREQALEEYIGNTTHDLAIPLTVLQHRLRKIAEEHPSDDIHVAIEESHYIAALIANMRAAARLEAGAELELSYTVNLTEIVERVAQRNRPIAAQKKVDLNYAVPDGEATVTGEPTLVEQALSNLVQNAVQYNSANGHVSIVLEQLDDAYELTVADDGPGIPAELRDVVMQRGVRADAARTRNEGGQGFGLSIVRRVVQLHDWELVLADSTEGLVVRITIPKTSRERS